MLKLDRVWLPLLSPLSATGESRCSVIGATYDCDVRNLVVLRRFLALPSLPPGLAPACEPIRYR